MFAMSMRVCAIALRPAPIPAMMAASRSPLRGY
jgi:hypothetical protein